MQGQVLLISDFKGHGECGEVSYIVIVIHTHFLCNEIWYIFDLMQEGIQTKFYVDLYKPYSCHVELIPLPYISKFKLVSSSLVTCNRHGSNK